MRNLHEHYDQLTAQELSFVNDLMGRNCAFKIAKQWGITLRGDDEAEKAVDAVAAWVIASRPAPEATEPKAVEASTENDRVIAQWYMMSQGDWPELGKIPGATAYGVPKSWPLLPDSAKALVRKAYAAQRENVNRAVRFNEGDCGGAFDGHTVTSDADSGL